MRYGNRSSWLSPHNTAPRVRAELQASQESTRALAARYGLNVKTVAKWGSRSTTTDKPMGPAKPCSVRLSDAEEAMVVDFRRRTLLPLDDLLGHLRETLPPLRIPDSVGVIDFHALERASLPKSLTCKLQGKRPAKSPCAPVSPPERVAVSRAECFSCITLCTLINQCETITG